MGESHVKEILSSGLVSKCRSDWCDVGRASGLEDRIAGTAGEGKGLFPPSLSWLCYLWVPSGKGVSVCRAFVHHQAVLRNAN